MRRRSSVVALSILVTGWCLLIVVQTNLFLSLTHDEQQQTRALRRHLTTPRVSSCRQQHNQTAAICAIQKGDLRYVDEWVDYHLALGFDTIYLMDNTDTFELRPWQEQRRNSNDTQERIRVTHVPGARMQNHAYRLCADQVERDQHTWVTFLDVDEFFVLRQHDNIVDFACQYVPHGHLGVNWVLFGTSGHTTYNNRPVTQRFQCRDEGSAESDFIKSILKVEDLGAEPIYDPHIFPRRNGTQLYHTDGEVFDQSRDQGPYNVAAIYHFFYKSHEEFIDKRRRGNAFFGPNLHLDSALAGIDQYGRQLPHGTVQDDRAWQTLTRLVPSYKDTYGDAPPIECQSNVCKTELRNAPTLEFLPIPPTGIIAPVIEAAGAAAGIRWGSCHTTRSELLGCCDPDAMDFRTRAHAPERRIFTVVRNPYEVCVSAFLQRAAASSESAMPCTVEELNTWIQEQIRQGQTTISANDTRAMSLLPQHMFIFNVTDGSPLADDILRYENLETEFLHLMRVHKLFVRLPAKWRSQQEEMPLTAANLTSETIALVNEYFVDDFAHFGYQQALS